MAVSLESGSAFVMREYQCYFDKQYESEIKYQARKESSM